MKSPSKQGKQGGQNDSFDLTDIDVASAQKSQQVWDISMISIQNDPEEKFLNEEESNLWQIETNSTLTGS